MVYPVLTKEEMTTESQRYNCFTRNGGNAIPKHADPEAKGSNPTTRLALLWARISFRGNFNHSQVSQKEAGQILFKRQQTIIFLFFKYKVYKNMKQFFPTHSSPQTVFFGGEICAR